MGTLRESRSESLAAIGFDNPVPVPLGGETKPRLFVVVDTEEEFDWGHPFSRSNTSVQAMRHLGRAHKICAAFGLRPTYVIDYPVAAQPEAYEVVADWLRSGECVVGAHLHPWVTPPFEEAVNGRNSFVCNIAPALQEAKIGALVDVIQANLAVRPRTFKAGRYGIGRTALQVLAARGFEVDASINPLMDFGPVEGPDFSACTARPFWFAGDILEVPCTHGYVGWARVVGQPVRRAAERPVLQRIRMPGIVARLGAVNQVMLSPEGNTLEEMVALTRSLMHDGLRVFSFSFHSPSVEPGHTPYVRSDRDLQEFLKRIERYFEFFFGELGGMASTPEDFRRDLLGRASAH